MSKRRGDVVFLDDFMDEVGVDAARWYLVNRGPDQTIDVDLDLAAEKSQKNPVYYVQYAHARIASIGRKAVEMGVTRLPVLDTSLAPLVHERELELLRALAAYPGVLTEAAALRAPHRVTTWVRDFAKSFHGFYRDCRVISDDAALTQARLWLAEACRLGLASALAVLGVHAPDEMTRLDDDEPES
jgi:arginyl-tRNA synthetase